MKATVTFRVTWLLVVQQGWASLQRAPVAGVPYLLALSKSSLNGVLGVECSNHSVPTIFFNDLAQPNPLGFFMPGEITPTFTPTDFFRRRELCAGLSTRQDFSSRERKYAICVLFVFVEHF